MGLHFKRTIQGLQAPRSRQPARLTDEGFGVAWQQVRLFLSSKLISGLTPERVVADAGYDFRMNREAVKKNWSKRIYGQKPEEKRKKWG